jgi:hypothetical protein
MANSSRSRRGTSPSFWRNHNGRQLMMAQACMPSVRLSPNPQVIRTKVIKAASHFPAESRKVFVVKL